MKVIKAFLFLSVHKSYSYSTFILRGSIFILEINMNDAIITSWLFSFRIIEPIVQWYTFKLLFVFVCSCSLQDL